MEIRVRLVDAFTDEPLSGNAAGVVPDAAGLSVEQMEAIANELAVSETAFVRDSDPAHRKIRFFTPTAEVDLCGHATIGTHAHLLADGVLDAGVHTMETNVGVLDVEVTDDGVVWMTQDVPTVQKVDHNYSTVADAVGIDPASLQDIGVDLPIARADTGLPFLIVPVTYLDAVASASPDDQAVADLCEPHGAAGIYLFTFDTLAADPTLHGRCFTAPIGIHEDPVTGTASGAVGAYLDRFGAFNELPDEMIFEQGHFLDRPGRVRVRVRGAGGVEVGGTGVTTLRGTLSVPEHDPDEILEA